MIARIASQHLCAGTRISTSLPLKFCAHNQFYLAQNMPAGSLRVIPAGDHSTFNRKNLGGGAASRERAAGELFQDVDGRFLGRHQGAEGDDEGLFEGRIGPDRTVWGRNRCSTSQVAIGGKAMWILVAIFLEAAALFQVVVEAEHELVVRRAVHDLDADGALERVEKRVGGVAAAGDFLEAGGLGKFLRERGKVGIGGEPVARAGGIDVRETAQDAATAGGARREGVHMQEVVALVEREVAVLFFLGAVTGVVERPMRGVGREHTREQPGNFLGEMAHDAVQPTLDILLLLSATCCRAACPAWGDTKYSCECANRSGVGREEIGGPFRENRKGCHRRKESGLASNCRLQHQRERAAPAAASPPALWQHRNQ